MDQEEILIAIARDHIARRGDSTANGIVGGPVHQQTDTVRLSLCTADIGAEEITLDQIAAAGLEANAISKAVDNQPACGAAPSGDAQAISTDTAAIEFDEQHCIIASS